MKVVIEQERTVTIAGQEFPETATIEGKMSNMEDIGVLANLLLGNFDSLTIRVTKEVE